MTVTSIAIAQPTVMMMAMRFEISVAIAPGPEHKSLESHRLYSQDTLIYAQ